MMKEINQKELDVALLLLRVVLGIYFVIAGLAQVATFAAGYREVFSGFAILGPIGGTATQTIVGILFPWIEIILGVLLVAGLATSVVAAVIALLSFVFTVIGGFIEGASLAKDILFVAVALVLMILGGGNISCDGTIKKGK